MHAGQAGLSHLALTVQMLSAGVDPSMGMGGPLALGYDPGYGMQQGYDPSMAYGHPGMAHGGMAHGYGHPGGY
jgi:hypothetical protein